jgi:3-oxoadipate enol-lactonase
VISPLHTRVSGPPDAPVLVLGGSLGTTGEMWAPQTAALGRHHRIVAFDHRGHGGSLVPPGPYTFDDLGRDVLAALDGLGVDRFAYGGLSMGGTLGIWLAARVPERVERLVLLCTSAYYGGPQSWRDRAHAVRRCGTQSIADAVIQRWFTSTALRERPELVQRHRQMLVDTPDEGYAGCCEALATVDLRRVLTTITVPTLVVAGAEDPSTPEYPHARLLAGDIPAARLVVLPAAAHLASVERADDVTELFRAELATS